MFNISINGDIYDCYTFGLEEKVFEAIIILNNSSMNDIIASVKKGNADIAEWANVLMGLASICEGEPLEDGRKFTRILTKLLEK